MHSAWDCMPFCGTEGHNRWSLLHNNKFLIHISAMANEMVARNKEIRAGRRPAWPRLVVATLGIQRPYGESLANWIQYLISFPTGSIFLPLSVPVADDETFHILGARGEMHIKGEICIRIVFPVMLSLILGSYPMLLMTLRLWEFAHTDSKVCLVTKVDSGENHPKCTLW